MTIDVRERRCSNGSMRALKTLGIPMLTVVAGLFAAARPTRAQTPPSPAPAPAAAPAVPGGAPARHAFFIKAEKGFIDDPIALAPDDGLLAVLLTDAASFARIDLVDLGTGKPRQTVELGDPQRLFERIVLAGDDKGLVLISRDGDSGKRSAQYYNAQGKPAGILGPVEDFGVATREGTRVLVALASQRSGQDTIYKVTSHRLDGLQRVGKTGAFTIKARELRRPPLKLVSWQRGYTEIIGLQPGSYDKAKDVRLPDKGAILDALGGTVLWTAEVGDVVAWAAASELRRKLPGRSVFAVFSPDTKIFDLVDFQGRRGPIELPVPLRYYDASTLHEQEAAQASGDSLMISLAIDPLHPEALARRKKDPAYLDLYTVRYDASRSQGPTGQGALKPQVERLLRAPMDDRPASWVAMGRHAAVLRKHKNFSRGGNLLEVYPLERPAP
jgi:hypothetical protein